MNANQKPRNRKLSPHLKPAKRLVRTYTNRSFNDPLAGEQDQNYLPPLAALGYGVTPRLDFGRPGW